MAFWTFPGRRRFLAVVSQPVLHVNRALTDVFGPKNARTVSLCGAGTIAACSERQAAEAPGKLLRAAALLAQPKGSDETPKAPLPGQTRVKAVMVAEPRHLFAARVIAWSAR